MMFVRVALLVAFGFQVHAEILKDFDSLGGNKDLLEQAKELRPDKEIKIVQDRIVQRRRRFELYPEFSMVVGGNSYLETNSVGLAGQYHFNSHWSTGVRYDYFGNGLTKEGKNMIDSDPRRLVPEVDSPKYQYLALLNWYPIYGKMNLYELGIVYFDLYLLGAYGQIALESGTTGTYQLGGGMGFWFSQHLSSRIEAKYQTYTAQGLAGDKSLDLTVLSLSLGYLL